MYLFVSIFADRHLFNLPAAIRHMYGFFSKLSFSRAADFDFSRFERCEPIVGRVSFLTRLTRMKYLISYVLHETGLIRNLNIFKEFVGYCLNKI